MRPRVLMPAPVANSSCVRPAATRWRLRKSPKERWRTSSISILLLPYSGRNRPMRGGHPAVLTLAGRIHRLRWARRIGPSPPGEDNCLVGHRRLRHLQDLVHLAGHWMGNHPLAVDQEGHRGGEEAV